VAAEAVDAQVQAEANLVVGLSLHQLDHLHEAIASYRQSIDLSVAHHLTGCEAVARAHLATTLVAVGDVASAEREITVATSLSSPANRGVVALRRAVVLQRTGRLSEAMVVFARALRWLEEVDDQPSLALAHSNRAVLCSYQGNFTAALESLSAAEKIERARDLPILLAMDTHNMGFVLGRLGKLPDALAAFARAGEAYAALGNQYGHVAVLDADRCEVLLLAGMVAEARAAASRAVEALIAVGNQAYLMECRVLLARALMAGGDYREAATQASLAAAEFDSAARPPWAALARYVGVQAEILESQDQAAAPHGLLPRCREIAAELDGQGWAVESVHVRTFAGRLALAFGQPEVARQELAQAVGARSRGTADLRAQAWLAVALLHLAEGNRSGAKRALGRGISVVDDYRASLGATELRVYAASHGAELARLGVRLALEDRRAVDVLRWAERWRAGALERRSVRPPDEERLAGLLTELRKTQAELRAIALSVTGDARSRPVGQAGAPNSDGAMAKLRDRIAELERLVRDETLQASDDTARTGRVDVASVRHALGNRWLIEYVALEGQLHAVTVTRDRVRLHHLGPLSVGDEKRYLFAALRRLWLSPGGAARQSLAATAHRLDEMLMAPLRLPADIGVVVVPTGVLHGLPWSALPSLAHRSTTVAPSTALWMGSQGLGSQGRTAPVGARSVALIAGPDLPGADDEVSQIDQLYRYASPPTATQVLVGPATTAAAVISALEASDVAHLAAHGRFRSDSPQFSSVLLADGPLTVYDLEGLRRAPRTVVVAACEAAVTDVRLGDELLGTAAALIGCGVQSVVAPVMRVPDGMTAPFMVALHRQLQAGQATAQALASARQGQDEAVGAAFICIGGNDNVSPS